MSLRAGTVQPGEKKAQEDLTNVYKNLTEGVKRTVKLFSREPRERTRGHGHKLKYRKFHSKPKKKPDFSSCEVGETDLWRV